jgi:general secretion pathway protein L
MRVGAILGRWIEVLAALLFAWQDAWRARHTLIVSHNAGGFVIRHAGAEGDEAFANLAPDTAVAEHVAQAARKNLMVLELPPEKVVTRRISVPAKAREFLPAIIRNQIDRLSPWQADVAVYGFAAEANREDAATLDVSVMITSRAVIEAARAEISAIGVAVDRIVVRAAAPAALVALWSRLADAPKGGRDRARRLIGVAIAGWVGLSLALTLWALISTASIRTASEDLSLRIKTLARQLHAGVSIAANAALNPEERAWTAKQTAPSAVVLLEALSRALPDTAHLTDLQFERTTLRMVGLATDAPSLIAPLERSGHLTGVRFFAPTTRSLDTTLYQFHIEAKVEPRLNLAQD